MGLNPKYVIAPSLESYFVDKTTGLPLANGQVFFFQDNARTVPKPVYTISGTPPNYSYTQLPNPVILSAVGTFSDDSGNDIIPYYFPYDNTGANVQLYYVAVYDQNGVLQFTREGWPNTVSETINPTEEDVTNFVPNGQFLLHNSIPAWTGNTFIANQLPAPDTTTVTDSTGNFDTTPIAQGGWTFERNTSSTATDLLTFPKYTSFIQSPTGNPLFACQLQNTVAGSDTRKDICLKFPNVNTFASGTTSYNFYLEGQSTSGNYNVQVIVRKFFGTGGSPSATTETVITSLSFTATVTSFNVPILFGTNAGKSIGTNGDDYVQVLLRFPPTSTFTGIVTDFAITTSNEVLTSFPQQTEAQQTDPSTAGWFPNPDPLGNDLYCPTILGPEGLQFDHSTIGEIVPLMVFSGSQTGNLLFCDGTQYLTQDYSSLGIPYSRLQKVLFNSSLNGPLFGTGATFANSYVNTGLTSELSLINNQITAQTFPADGGVPTDFTFNEVSNAGVSPAHAYQSFSNSTSDNVIAYVNNPGGVATGIDVSGTPGLVGGDLHQSQSGLTLPIYAFFITALSASAMSAGSGMSGYYFDFSASPRYRMWFKVNGEVAPGSGGNTLLECNLQPNMTGADTAKVIAAVIQGFQTTTIRVTALPTAGSYFTFFASSNQYAVWYSIAGAGTAPIGFTKDKLIPVALTGSETNAQVVTKTITAMNSQYFAVPDLRGYFLRGADTTGAVDTGDAYRYGFFGNTNYLGTYQLDAILEHFHTLNSAATGGGATQGGSSGNGITGYTGDSESRPRNASVNYFIRY